MKRHFPKIAAALVVLMIGSWLNTTPVRAQELYNDSAEVNKMMTKLGRGVANLLTGWMEVPKQMSRSIRQTDPVTGTFIGLFRGFGWTWARTFAGAYEIITFPFPAPKDYKSLIEPPYIVTDLWGEPIPAISDPHNNWVEPRVPDYGTGEPVRSIVP